MLGAKKKDKDAPDERTTAWEDRTPESAPAPAQKQSSPTPAPSRRSEASTFIAKGSEFVGKLTFDGTVEIDGRVQGEIFSKGTLVIGPSAEIKASINVDTCVIKGTVHGNVNARTKLELAKPGKLYGDIRSPTLVLEAGVIFEGHCRMENLAEPEKTKSVLPEGRTGAVQ